MALAAVGALLWTILQPGDGDPGDSFRRVAPPTIQATGATDVIIKGATKNPSKDKGPSTADAATARRRARHAAVVAQSDELSRAQADIVETTGETDRDAAMVDFAESRRAEIDAFLAARDELLAVPVGAGQGAPPLPESVAMRDRFDAVRRALIEDGVTLDQAESEFAAKSPDP